MKSQEKNLIFVKISPCFWYTEAMTNTDKFLADIKRIIKRNRSSGITYDGVECSRQVAQLFCSYYKDLGDLPNSISEYWLNTYIVTSGEISEEPSREHQDWLADVLELLAGEEGEFKSITQKDWVSLRDLINYEAEELPVEVLSSLMGVLLERGAL